MNHEDKLRQILRAEVDTIEPSPAGWDRIKDGVVVRRRRRVWQRSALAAATALSLVAVIALVVNRDDESNRANIVPATDAPTPEPSPSDPAPSPTGQSASIAADDPLPIVWPFSTRRQIDQWQANPSSHASLRDGDTAVREFVKTYLGLSGVDVGPAGAAAGSQYYPVTRRIVASDPSTEITICTVQLTQNYGGSPSSPGPWVVTSVIGGEAGSDNVLTITSPVFDDVHVATSPLHVTGTVKAVDESVRVEVRTTDPSTTTKGYRTLGEAHAMAGMEAPWAADVTFVADPKSVGGVVLAGTASPADGLPSRIAVTPIAFASSKTTSDSDSSAASYPAQFVAVEKGRIGLYDTKTGTRVRYLTETGASDPSVTPDGAFVVYVHMLHECAAEIRKVAIAGGSPVVLEPSVSGHVASLPGVSKYGELAYGLRPCDSYETEIIVGTQHFTTSESLIEMAWTPDGRRIAALTGTCCDGGSEIIVISPSDGKRSDAVDNAPPPDGQSCMSTAVDYTSSGTMVTAETCWTEDRPDLPRANRVIRYDPAGPRVLIDVAEEIEDLDVDRSAQQFLVVTTPCTNCADEAYTVRRLRPGSGSVTVARGLTQPAWAE